MKEDAAAGILAEVGVDMRVFPSDGHFSSWAGVCPRNRRSAGKDKGSRTNRGNRWLRGMLTECAWAAAGKKDCYLKGKFWRLAADGKKKAIVAVLTTCFDWSITSSAKANRTKRKAVPFWTSDSDKG